MSLVFTLVKGKMHLENYTKVTTQQFADSHKSIKRKIVSNRILFCKLGKSFIKSVVR